MKRYKDVVKTNIAPKSKFGTNPSDPWSAKAGLAEGRNSILKKYILSKGIDPRMLSGDSMIAFSKSLEFQKWAADRDLRGESVESPTLLSQRRIQAKLAKHKVIHPVGGLGEESELDETYPEKNPNFDDELSNRRVGPIGKRLKSGKLDYAERSSQDRLKRLMKFTKTKGGLAGPKGNLPEAVDRKDTVTINIPLLIRLLELAREDVKTDMELHHIVERIINIRNRGVLSMDHYNYIAGKSRKVFREETDLNDYGTIVKESVSDWGNYTVHTSTGKHTVYGPSDDHAEMTKHLHRQMGGHGKIIYGDIKKIEPHTDAVANTRDPKSNRSYNESIIDEMSGANMDTREVHQHLKKGGWKLSRSTGGHDVFTHPDSDEHIPVPRHRQLKAPLILSILKTAKKRTGVTEDKFQDPNAATQTTGMEVESKASKLIKSLRKESTMKEELYDWEKEDKSVETYGKKPKFGKPNPNSKSNLAAEKSVARAVMSGGKTLTGETRDDVEIDPMMKKRPTEPMDAKKKVTKTKI
jgi:predicted RNA binding protein YcfA (HicA-like mRNA interferase family)